MQGVAASDEIMQDSHSQEELSGHMRLHMHLQSCLRCSATHEQGFVGSGETIPASDSEEELPGNMVMDGIYRQQQDHVLQGIVQEFGISHRILLILAEKLDTNVGKVIANEPSVCDNSTSDIQQALICFVEIVTSNLSMAFAAG